MQKEMDLVSDCQVHISIEYRSPVVNCLLEGELEWILRNFHFVFWFKTFKSRIRFAFLVDLFFYIVFLFVIWSVTHALKLVGKVGKFPNQRA